jgi:hypothetical protein
MRRLASKSFYEWTEFQEIIKGRACAAKNWPRHRVSQFLSEFAEEARLSNSSGSLN